MPEIEICVKCGEQLIPGFIIQDQMVMICVNCDDDSWEDETHPDEYCSCYQGEINIFCRWCF